MDLSWALKEKRVRRGGEGQEEVDDGSYVSREERKKRRGMGGVAEGFYIIWE